LDVSDWSKGVRRLGFTIRTQQRRLTSLNEPNALKNVVSSSGRRLRHWRAAALADGELIAEKPQNS
jgi:hypothetical protein